ncbi:hypothetical protein MCOR27_005591 [Pyricularia oryzae]|uniref:Uncharacterized protein n=5 Tax=Pyricularia TaxID=48558 RepID=A0ABQ8NRY8_PYRGI|nr:uncharacterized protein MGG_17382 [Pyricularia oryzae 70-15]ELQ36074.1 hypothetical protein OOU_Y34scaffold00669g59 [Pyricularia oryzae Y34]KAH8840660.1 hypothetical protein MCOR01_007356 [Pyricularia oryzae]KAI6301009.1 hypothetical protein MCOR33_003355 [Pyricularia grisea]EHA48690.1 hypothetical protein MGG_17382 [Pyricularia oryzae 70-15]KAI6278434.1 hypothetical protein MCOR27_005591 [Pyricularia oryzae]
MALFLVYTTGKNKGSTAGNMVVAGFEQHRQTMYYSGSFPSFYFVSNRKGASDHILVDSGSGFEGLRGTTFIVRFDRVKRSSTSSILCKSEALEQGLSILETE